MSSDLEHRVRAFVARETAARLDRVDMNTTLFADLGVDGEDGSHLIEAFGKEFNVDIAGFDHSKHFGPEAGCPLPLVPYFLVRSFTREAHDAAGVVPISVRDLVDAAREGRWLK